MAGQVKGITNFLSVKPEYGVMGSQNIADTAREFASVYEGNALAANAGMKATADMAATQHYADASARAADASFNSSIVGGVAGGLKGAAPAIAKFLGKGGGGGGLGSFDPVAKTSNLFGNKIGSFGGGSPLGSLIQ